MRRQITERKQKNRKMKMSQLPQDCIAHIISLTSPKDACKFCLVSPLFRSASDSDVVWEKFLPPNHDDLISRSAVAETTLRSMPKKALYFHLCDNPIILDDLNLSFTLDRSSGKKCFMIGARGLGIIWGNAPHYWEWMSLPESRFAEVARLLIVWWLDIRGSMETRLLSTETTYAAYLVFKLAEGSSGFNQNPVQFHIDFQGQGNGEGARVFLDPPGNAPPPLPQDRRDGWKEIEMGEFLNGHGEDGPVSCGLREVDNHNPKSGLIIEGIEFRPKLTL